MTVALLSTTDALADPSKMPDVLQGRWYPLGVACGSADALKGGVVFDATTMTSTTGAYACTFERLAAAKKPPPDAVGEWNYRKTCVLNLPDDHGTMRQYGWMRLTVGKDGQHLEAHDSDNDADMFEGPKNPGGFDMHRC